MLLSEYILLPKENRTGHIDLSSPCIRGRYQREWKEQKQVFLDFLGVTNDIELWRGKVHRCHLCDCHTKSDGWPCINPSHIYIGLPKENSWDRPLDKRQAGGHSLKGKKTGPKSEEHRKSISLSAKRREEKWRIEGGRPRFQCLVTGHISTGTGLTHYQRFRNIDTKLRKRI